MKFIFKTMLIAGLSAFMQMYSPWWGIALVAFFVSVLLYTKGFSSFLSGFLAIFLLWGLKAYFIDSANEQILSTKITQLFSVTPFILLLITGVVGGTVGGFASLAGSNFSSMFRKEKRRKNKYYL